MTSPESLPNHFITKWIKKNFKVVDAPPQRHCTHTLLYMNKAQMKGPAANKCTCCFPWKSSLSPVLLDCPESVSVHLKVKHNKNSFCDLYDVKANSFYVNVKDAN